MRWWNAEWKSDTFLLLCVCVCMCMCMCTSTCTCACACACSCTKDCAWIECVAVCCSVQYFAVVCCSVLHYNMTHARSIQEWILVYFYSLNPRLYLHAYVHICGVCHNVIIRDALSWQHLHVRTCIIGWVGCIMIGWDGEWVVGYGWEWVVGCGWVVWKGVSVRAKEEAVRTFCGGKFFSCVCLSGQAQVGLNLLWKFNWYACAQSQLYAHAWEWNAWVSSHHRSLLPTLVLVHSLCNTRQHTATHGNTRHHITEAYFRLVQVNSFHRFEVPCCCLANPYSQLDQLLLHTATHPRKCFGWFCIALLQLCCPHIW